MIKSTPRAEITVSHKEYIARLMMSSEKLTELKERINWVRKQAGLKGTEFADRLGVSAAYISELESGKKTNASLSLAKLISHEFNINLDWLISGEGERYRRSNIMNNIIIPTETGLDNSILADFFKKVLRIVSRVPGAEGIFLKCLRQAEIEVIAIYGDETISAAIGQSEVNNVDLKKERAVG